MTTTAMDTKHKELPAGWKWVKLGDVCEEDRKTIIGDSYEAKSLPYLSLEHVESETGKILTTAMGESVESVGKSNTFYFDENHVLYGKLRPYLNKVGQPDFSGRCTTELIPLLPTLADRNYLWWLLKRPETVSYAMMGKTGSRMPRTDMKEFMRMRIPLPPLEEQKRIAAILNEQMATVEKAKKAAEDRLEAAQALPAAYLRDAFPGSEDELPDGWESVELGDVCELFQGLAINKNTKHLLVDKSSLPLLRIKDLRTNTVEQYISEHGFPKGALVSEKDLLYTRTGNSLGLVFTGRRGILHNNCFKIEPNSRISSAYLRWFLEDSRFKSTIYKLASSSAQPDISHKIFKQQPIPLPPMEQQHRIATELEEKRVGVKLAEQSIQQELDTIEAMPASLLRKAFSGEL